MILKKKILFSVLLLFSVACVFFGEKEASPVLGETFSEEPQVILQRLDVEYLGLDGHRLIGSGCPGNDGKGSIENIHFLVHGVDRDRKVQRNLVAGDNSTLTWETPCSGDWGLLALDLGKGTWEIFIVPSLPSEIYTVIFFYDDNTFALGMNGVP